MRSKNGWDSHLGVLQQDLEDLELVGDDAEGLSRYEAASRNDALADALGVQRRSTPRNATGGGVGGDTMGTNSRSARSGGATNYGSTKNKASKNSMNVSLLSPMSKPADPSHDAEMSMDHHTLSTMRMGTFSNLHPTILMSCVYCDGTPTVPAEKIFLASNFSGSGRLSLSLLCPSGQKTSVNPKVLRLFTFRPKNTTNNDTDGAVDFDHKLVVESEGSIPCAAAQPVQASPVPKNYEPHRKNRSRSWNSMATDVLLLQKHDDGAGKLSLYRNTHHIVDCDINSNHDGGCKVLNLRDGVGKSVDVILEGEGTNPKALRAQISLKLESSFLAESILQTVEAALEKIGLLDLALKIRADCARLFDFLIASNDSSYSNGEIVGKQVVETVLHSLFALEVLSEDVNSSTDSHKMVESSGSFWDKLQGISLQEEFASEFADLMVTHSIDSATSGSLTALSGLSNLGSLAVEFAKSCGGIVSIPLFDSLHLFYEEMKLHLSDKDAALQLLGSLLREVCRMTFRSPTFSDEIAERFLIHYNRDLPQGYREDYSDPHKTTKRRRKDS